VSIYLGSNQRRHASVTTNIEVCYAKSACTQARVVLMYPQKYPRSIPQGGRDCREKSIAVRKIHVLIASPCDSRACAHSVPSGAGKEKTIPKRAGFHERLKGVVSENAKHSWQCINDRIPNRISVS